jgi:hypothetical protein
MGSHRRDEISDLYQALERNAEELAVFLEQPGSIRPTAAP